jgi:phosphoglycerol transferase MdoB-like AlkP superfamily enzyme
MALPPVLLLALVGSAAVASRGFRRFIAGYISVVLTVGVALQEIGVYFFRHFGFRLNWMAIENLGGGPREILQYIWQEYPIVWFGLRVLVMLVGFYVLVMRLGWRGQAPTSRLWQRAILTVALVGLCALAIRGSLDRRPLRVGTANKFSNNNVIIELTKSDVFTIKNAIVAYLADQSVKDAFPLPKGEDAFALVAKGIYQPGDTSLGDKANPLWRRTDTGLPARDYNVVIIIMESMSGWGVGALDHQPSYTPVLDQLGKDGVVFDHFYANGNRTNRGICSTLCGYPDVGVEPAMKQDRALGHFLSLPLLLKARGYKTQFVYGGKPAWDNIKGFFSVAGIDGFIGQEGGADESGSQPWGVPDELTFRRLHEWCLAQGDKKFMAAVMTISNHEPFTAPACGAFTPEGATPSADEPANLSAAMTADLAREPEVGSDAEKLHAQKINCYRYADWAIGNFLRQARQSPYFKKTIFVLVADHGRDFKPDRVLDLATYRIPCVIYAPGIVPPRRVSTVCSQADISPTLLGLLGGQFEHCFLGRDMLKAAAGDGCALMGGGEATIGFVHNDWGMILRPESKPLLYRLGINRMDAVPANKESQQVTAGQQEALSFYGVARKVYLDATYCPPEMRVAKK